MNLYDEAIEEIKSCFYDGGEFPKTIKALERAKKFEELLGLYKELAIVRFYLFSETDADLGQELMNKDDDLNKQIKQLEEEMK